MRDDSPILQHDNPIVHDRCCIMHYSKSIVQHGTGILRCNMVNVILIIPLCIMIRLLFNIDGRLCMALFGYAISVSFMTGQLCSTNYATRGAAVAAFVV